jgi:hypothetical protein
VCVAAQIGRRDGPEAAAAGIRFASHPQDAYKRRNAKEHQMTFRASPIAASAVALALALPCGVALAQDSPSYTIEDVTACSADAMRLCRDKMPDIDRIEACMKANYENLRPKCKARFDHDH